jgi:hypothetical protein
MAAFFMPRFLGGIEDQANPDQANFLGSRDQSNFLGD